MQREVRTRYCLIKMLVSLTIVIFLIYVLKYSALPILFMVSMLENPDIRIANFGHYVCDFLLMVGLNLFFNMLLYTAHLFSEKRTPYGPRSGQTPRSCRENHHSLSSSQSSYNKKKNAAILDENLSASLLDGSSNQTERDAERMKEYVEKAKREARSKKAAKCTANEIFVKHVARTNSYQRSRYVGPAGITPVNGTDVISEASSKAESSGRVESSNEFSVEQDPKSQMEPKTKSQEEALKMLYLRQLTQGTASSESSSSASSGSDRVKEHRWQKTVVYEFNGKEYRIARDRYSPSQSSAGV